jgi:hypothetical protein
MVGGRTDRQPVGSQGTAAVNTATAAGVPSATGGQSGSLLNVVA